MLGLLNMCSVIGVSHRLAPPTGCPRCGKTFDYSVSGGGPGHEECWAYWQAESDLKWLRTAYQDLRLLLDEAASIGKGLVELQKELSMDRAGVLHSRVTAFKLQLGLVLKKNV